MEPEKPVEPVTLNYAPVQNTRRRSALNTTLVILAVLNLFVFATRHIAPRVLGTSSCPPISTTRANMDSLQSMFALYHLHVGAYPTSLDDFVRPPAGEAGAKWRGPYLDGTNILKDAWGRPFRYRAPGVNNPRWYDLWSAGRDGADGTADDDKNW